MAVSSQKDCSVLEAGAAVLVLFSEYPRAAQHRTAQPSSLLGCCWHLVERGRSGWRANTLFSQEDPTQSSELALDCRVQIPPPALARVVAAKTEAIGMERCGSNSPLGPHSTGSSHRQTQRPLFIIFIECPLYPPNRKSIDNTTYL